LEVKNSRNGYLWSLIDSLGGQGINFVIGIILARILGPTEYGIIGMLSVFLAIAQTLIDGGFSNALIRKNESSENDLTTIFYYNLAISSFLYCILFFSAPYVAIFFNQKKLEGVLKVLAIILIINAFGQVQRTLFIKKINFKVQTQISIITSIFSGAIGLILAFLGYGVWSLVYMQIVKSATNTILFWFKNDWRPKGKFSKQSFDNMFSFGSKLLLSNLIATFYQNLSALIIGKYYSPIDLGNYTKANEIRNVPSRNLYAVFGRVSYPILATMQENPQKLFLYYQRLIKRVSFLSFNIMLFMSALAPNIIFVLLGHNWAQSITYLQIMSIGAMLYPLHAINLNILQVYGKSNRFLYLEIIKKITALPILIASIWMGINFLLWGMLVHSLFSYIVNSIWSGDLIGYSIKEQIQDIIPSLIFAILASGFVLLIGYFINSISLYSLLIRCFLCMITFIFLGEISKLDNYLYFKNILLTSFSTIRIKRFYN